MSESELGSAAVCNLERGVKIAVERAARVRERGERRSNGRLSGDKSRRRYNVGL